MSVNYEWYQTDQKVVVTVKIKLAAEKNCVVEIGADRVTVTGDDGISLTLELYQNINEAESGYKMTPMKIEINLKKLIGDRWPTLVKTTETPKVPAPPLATLSDSAPTPAVESNATKVPRNHKDWDKVVSAVYTKDDEKAEENELNALFQKIYASADPEVQRAMNKSFTESGGTVLSTNWKEVGAQKVDVKPPDGVEYRSWEE